MIKEVAPIEGAEADEILGVDAFHQKYFLNNPLYIDLEKKIVGSMGNRDICAYDPSIYIPLYKVCFIF